MTLDELKASLAEEQPADGLSLALQALWHDAKGHWNAAHQLAQTDNGRDGAWVHAYLHRKEGDNGNAGYWYFRAGRSAPQLSPEKEWDEIAEALLEGRGA